MDLTAGWEGTWQQFLNTDKERFIATLKRFYESLKWTTDLSPTQLYAWESEYDVMTATLEHVKAEVALELEKCWIAFEKELIGEGGKRAADVNLVTPSGELFVVEFKHKERVTEHEILRANSDLQTMLRYHSESINLVGHGFLVLTKPGSESFEHPHVVCDIADSGLASKLSSKLITSLKKPEVYDVQNWKHGEFYRQPSILHGTAQVFFDAKIPTLKTSAGENIDEARAALLKLYHTAKERQQRYVVVVHGRPGAGKTLLGISAVAEIARSESQKKSEPIFLSGNKALVNVLQYTLNYSAAQAGKQFSDKVIDGRVMIEHLYVFKKHVRSANSIRKETFVVFDEAQRAWNSSKNSESDLTLCCDWLSKQPFGVLVLLVGDGQAIHTKEMELDQMLVDLERAVSAQKGRVIPIMPSLHASKMKRIKPIKRDVFNLKTPIRQSFTEELDEWIEAVLSNNFAKAQEVASKIQPSYPIRVTRSKKAAEDFASDCQQTMQEGNKIRQHAFRVGWLQSGKGGEFMEKVDVEGSKYNSAIGPWYVDPPSSEHSCCQFNAACDEFTSQGLELSFALFNWGHDLIYRNGKLEPVKCRDYDHYTEGSYRVLLSRGRSGMVIKCDDTETYEYLARCGAVEI